MNECVIYLPVGFILIPLAYIFAINSFYDHQKSRDYLPNVRRRFLAAIFINLIAVPTTYFLLGWVYQNPFKQMGIQADGILTAALLPSFLTIIFYTGTLAMEFKRESGTSFSFPWQKLFTDPLWIRQAIMAPMTEEVAFRACAAPLLRHCLGDMKATVIAPISFSLSHIHHLIEDKREGKPFPNALVNRGFQMLYTYLFGVYATHIFFQTGHIIAPILSHSICNLFGLPTINEVHNFESQKIRAFLYCLHFGGFIAWFLLRPYLLCSDLYY